MSLFASGQQAAGSSSSSSAAVHTGWHQQTLVLKAKPQGCHIIDKELFADEALRAVLARYKVGMCNLFLQHTSASLSINESWDSDVRLDAKDWLCALAPESKTRYRHDDEGPDDMPAHLKTIMCGVSVNVPIQQGRLGLGQWQGIWLNEHRAAAGRRKVIVTLQGLCTRPPPAQSTKQTKKTTTTTTTSNEAKVAHD
jgi:secondary thiamine-phosphate synthase enzyme